MWRCENVEMWRCGNEDLGHLIIFLWWGFPIARETISNLKQAFAVQHLAFSHHQTSAATQPGLSVSLKKYAALKLKYNSR